MLTRHPCKLILWSRLNPCWTAQRRVPMSQLLVQSVTSFSQYVTIVEQCQQHCAETLWYRGCGSSRQRLIPGLYRHEKKKTVGETAAPEKRDSLLLKGRVALDSLDDMANIFLPKDYLLAGAGIVPVYYWFVRNTIKADHSRIRPFLVEFERKRRANRELIASDPKSAGIDNSLTSYDRYNRSTNDLQSHEGRLKILRESFANYRVFRPRLPMDAPSVAQ